MQSDEYSSGRARLNRRQALTLAGAAAMVPLLGATRGLAAAYPSGTVTMILPLPPGGVLDVLGRGLGDLFQTATGQSLILEHAPGATGLVGSAKVARAKPDGYTILLGNNAPFITGRYVTKQMPLDTDKDLRPVILTTQSVMAIAVHESLGVNTLEELIALAKAKPGQIGYASAGLGSPHHITAEYFSEMAGIKLNHIPYKGSADAQVDVIAGHVPVGILPVGGVIEQVRAGTVKLLAVTTNARTPDAPDVPAVAEILPGFVDSPTGWNAIFVPAGVSDEVVAVLNTELGKALGNAELDARLRGLFLEPLGGTPQDVTDRIMKERAVVEKLIGRLGLTPT